MYKFYVVRFYVRKKCAPGNDGGGGGGGGGERGAGAVVRSKFVTGFLSYLYFLTLFYKCFELKKFLMILRYIEIL